MTDGPKVIDLDARRREQPPARPTIERTWSIPCRHSTAQVDEGARVVTCAKCGVALDPIHVLGEIANRERSLYYSRVAIAQAEKRLAELKAEERKAKARVTRARNRAASLEGDG